MAETKKKTTTKKTTVKKAVEPVVEEPKVEEQPVRPFRRLTREEKMAYLIGK